MTLSVISSATSTDVTALSSRPARNPALSKLICVSSGAFSQRKAKMSLTVVMLFLLRVPAQALKSGFCVFNFALAGRASQHPIQSALDAL